VRGGRVVKYALRVAAEARINRAMASAAWKMPPLAKVYEALGAVGDGRVQIVDAMRATVTSSDGSKRYEVVISADGREISSNDNASFWQGYLGYPAIAVMITRGLIERRDEAIRALTGVPWKALNTRYRNDYDRTVDDALSRAAAQGFDAGAIRATAEAVLDDVRAFAPLRGPRRPPPRAK
jgi:hypothetical protein